MTAQVKPWGNSQGIRLSKKILDSAGIHVNDYLEIEIIDGSIVLSKAFRHQTLEERAAAYGGKLTNPGEINLGTSDPPEGREVW